MYPELLLSLSVVFSPVRVALGTIFRRDAVTRRSRDERAQRQYLINITAIFHISSKDTNQCVPSYGETWGER